MPAGPDDFKIVPQPVDPKDKIPTHEELSEGLAYRKLNPVFCFRFLDSDDKQFTPRKIQKAKTFHIFLDKLRLLCNLTWGEIERVKAYHAHDLNWRDISKARFPKGCGDFPPYQFAINNNEFRIIGFHADNRFFVVWFDPDHKMDPSH